MYNNTMESTMMERMMQGDISYSAIKNVLKERWHDGNTDWLTDIAMEQFKYYKHCSTSMGYSAEFIAGAIVEWCRRNNFKVFI
jgi:hypothetical protein